MNGMEVNEKDWKLFRKNLPDWQENYMEKLIKEYIEFLKGDGFNVYRREACGSACFV